VQTAVDSEEVFYASRAQATSVSQERSNPRRRLKSSASAVAAGLFTGIVARRASTATL
jgi:hypothetical protein